MPTRKEIARRLAYQDAIKVAKRKGCSYKFLRRWQHELWRLADVLVQQDPIYLAMAATRRKKPSR